MQNGDIDGIHVGGEDRDGADAGGRNVAPLQQHQDQVQGERGQGYQGVGGLTGAGVLEQSTVNIPEYNRLELPNHLPNWPEIKTLLIQLTTPGNTKDIEECMKKIALLARDELAFEKTRFDNLGEYLKTPQSCDLTTVIPVIARSALAVQVNQPFLGLYELTNEGSVNLRSDLLRSLLALSFFSAYKNKDLNLNVHSLDLSEGNSWHLLNTFIKFFIPDTPVGLLRLAVSTTSSPLRLDSMQTSLNLCPLRFGEVSEDESYLHVEELETLRISNIRNCDSLKNYPECTLVAHFVQFLQSNMAMRAWSVDGEGGERRNVSVYTPPNTQGLSGEEKIQSLVNSFYTAFRRVEIGGERSALRKPSVAAVTSADSDEEISMSLSDSYNRESESGESYSLDEEEEEEHPPARLNPPKLKKRESFKARLKAALARGNTPDIESDDQSGMEGVREARSGAPRYRKPPKREPSIGFRAFTLPMEESDDFFTATDEEFSAADRMPQNRFLARNPLIKEDQSAENPRLQSSKPLIRPVQNKGDVDVPVNRRRMMKDKSFDFSTSSNQFTSPQSRNTSSSCLFSDSISISSAELGIPNLNDQHLEEVVETLGGCLEVGDQAVPEPGGGLLQSRNIFVKQVWSNLRRSLSDTQLGVVEDLEVLPYLDHRDIYRQRKCHGKPRLPAHLESVTSDLSSSLSESTLPRQTKAFSCCDLATLGKCEAPLQKQNHNLLPVTVSPAVLAQDPEMTASAAWLAATLVGLPALHLNLPPSASSHLSKIMKRLQNKTVQDLLNYLRDSSSMDELD